MVYEILATFHSTPNFNGILFSKTVLGKNYNDKALGSCLLDQQSIKLFNQKGNILYFNHKIELNNGPGLETNIKRNEIPTSPTIL